jgi:hypothetical protein
LGEAAGKENGTRHGTVHEHEYQDQTNRLTET